MTIKTNGPGKYDEQCERAMFECKAVGVLLVVIEGEHGNGFSVNTLEPELIPVLPAMLRAIALDIERQNQRSAN